MKAEKENNKKEEEEVIKKTPPIIVNVTKSPIAKKLKVVFTKTSVRAGEKAYLDRGLATMYEKQGIVTIIKK